MIPSIANPTELVGAMPLHLACARPLCRLKAPLGLLLLRKRELAYGRQSRLIMPPAKKNRAFPTGNALLYISRLSVVFGRVRPGGRTLFFSVCLTNNHCVALTSKDSSFLMTLIRIVAISYRCHFECLGVSDVTRL